MRITDIDVIITSTTDTTVLEGIQTGGEANGIVDLWGAKRLKFPKASILFKNYPLPYFDKPCNEKDSKGESLYPNQCAIRMSLSFINSGVKLNKYSDPKCKHGYARGAKSLANWIIREKLLCHPKVFKNATEKDVIDFIKDKSGIIFFHNINAEQDNDHIDLYFQNNLQATYTNLWTATEFWFFLLNE
jgi:Type VI secretion system (T6SS), amidase effector protein 4